MVSFPLPPIFSWLKNCPVLSGDIGADFGLVGGDSNCDEINLYQQEVKKFTVTIYVVVEKDTVLQMSLQSEYVYLNTFSSSRRSLSAWMNVLTVL